MKEKQKIVYLLFIKIYNILLTKVLGFIIRVRFVLPLYHFSNASNFFEWSLLVRRLLFNHLLWFVFQSSLYIHVLHFMKNLLQIRLKIDSPLPGFEPETTSRQASHWAMITWLSQQSLSMSHYSHSDRALFPNGSIKQINFCMMYFWLSTWFLNFISFVAIIVHDTSIRTKMKQIY